MFDLRWKTLRQSIWRIVFTQPGRELASITYTLANA